MRISKDIEKFLKLMLEQADGSLEIQRNELAGKFNCVPSQINYVISTRFKSECGYHVESRRGGGGYIKITRVPAAKGYIMHSINSVGDIIDWQTTVAIVGNCLDYDEITQREARIILSALNDNSLISVQQPERDRVRARILKTVMANIASHEEI